MDGFQRISIHSSFVQNLQTIFNIRNYPSTQPCLTDEVVSSELDTNLGDLRLHQLMHSQLKVRSAGLNTKQPLQNMPSFLQHPLQCLPQKRCKNRPPCPLPGGRLIVTHCKALPYIFDHFEALPHTLRLPCTSHPLLRGHCI